VGTRGYGGTSEARPLSLYCRSTGPSLPAVSSKPAEGVSPSKQFESKNDLGYEYGCPYSRLGINQRRRIVSQGAEWSEMGTVKGGR
jgi:hypothetical protein